MAFLNRPIVDNKTEENAQKVKKKMEKGCRIRKEQVKRQKAKVKREGISSFELKMQDCVDWGLSKKVKFLRPPSPRQGRAQVARKSVTS
ncbi:MAG: hypothetical protein ACYS7Y_09645 [Planctomycetota bacterium]|jgi:hypothetical protein